MRLSVFSPLPSVTPVVRLEAEAEEASVFGHNGRLSISLVSVVFLLACTDGAKSDTNPGAWDSGLDSGTAHHNNHASLGPIQPCEAPMEAPRWRERAVELGLPDRPDDGRVQEGQR